MIEHHPLSELFPLLIGEEFEEFADDISVNGLRHPVVMYEGKILDGRNRYAACKARSINPTFEDYTGADPHGFVISENLARRHLNEAQRSLIAARLATRTVGSPLQTQQEAPTRKQAAAMLNVTEHSVEHARRVVKRGEPELIAAVEQGKIKTRTAAKIATLPPADQLAALAGDTKEKPEPQPEPEHEESMVDDNRRFNGRPQGSGGAYVDAGPEHIIGEIRTLIDGIGSRNREVLTIAKSMRIELCLDFARALAVAPPGRAVPDNSGGMGSQMDQLGER